MTFQKGDIVMTLKGSIHWTVLDPGDIITICESQMTGRRAVFQTDNLRYWRPGD